MIRLILGRAGYGKTEYVFNKIDELVNAGEQDILLITPEQFSFISERKLLSMLGESRVNCVENMSFSRLSSEASRIYGGDRLPVLTKGSKAVMMKKAIEMVNDSLVLFKNNYNSNAFINSAIKIYDEMKSCRISADEIFSASQGTGKQILSMKLQDISTIISAYDALIKDKYLDSASELTRLYEKLIDKDYFVDKYVFIDGFSGFVAQEYKIIEIIIKQAKEVNITFCTDSISNSDKYDLFSYVNTNIAILKGVANKAGVSFAEPVILDKNMRYKYADLALVEKNLYAKIKTKNDTKSDNINIYSAKNIMDECDNVAKNISKLLRSGYRAKDIAVICRDLDAYESYMISSFNKFNIPYFNDERQNIASQPIIMLVNFLMRVCIYSFKTDDIISLLKTGLTELDNDSINNLENYAYLWKISGSKWKSPFIASTKGFVDEVDESDQKRLDAINKSRQYIIDALVGFSKSIKSKSCRDISKAIYYTLIKLSADKKLKELAVSLDKSGKSALAKEQGRVWDLLMNILDKLAVVGGDSVITIKEYYNLFSLMISNEDLGTLPSGLDNVQLGSADRIRCDNPRAVFVIGANEGQFPQSVTSAGLLSENDRIELVNIDNDMKLYSYGETLNAQEKYFAYMAVSAAKERLFVSYIGANNKGAESSIVTGIKTIFPSITVEKYSDALNIDSIESVENAFDILASRYNDNNEFVASLKEYFASVDEYSNRIDAVNRLVDNEQLELKDKELAKRLFMTDMVISASKVENYFNCSFRYFCKYGIGARPRRKAEMNSMETGNVIHFVLEQLIKNNKNLKDLTDSEISILVSQYLKEYLETKMGDNANFTKRFNYQFMRLSRMITTVVIRLRNEFAQSDFEPRAFELNIGGDKEDSVESRRITLPDGGSIRINGAVDRVDVLEKNGVKYVRVVDYKSGTKVFSLNDIVYGLNLQMFIYLFTLCSSDSDYSGIASGVLYMHSNRKVMNLTRYDNLDSIAKLENKEFKMNGVVLNDDEHQIAECMEHELKGEYIPVSYSDKRGIYGNIVTLEQLGKMSRYIESLIIQMGDSLHSGRIMQNPIHSKKYQNTCNNCDYSDVCKNRREIEFKELDELSNDDVIKMICEEDNSDDLD